MNTRTQLSDEELADRLADDADRPIPVAHVRVVPAVLRDIAEAVDARGAADEHVARAVAAAREAGHTWGEIAQRLGVTRQAAHARYASRHDD